MALNQRKDLYISFGKLSEDDKSRDIEFWQKTSFSERARAALEMVESVFYLKTGIDPSTLRFSWDCIESGSLADRKKIGEDNLGSS